MSVLFAGMMVVGMTSPAADLIIAENKRCDYQIVVPDTYPAPEVGEWLDQTARLVQNAFKANTFELPIVKEGAKAPAKPAIYLGDTAFARAHGVDVSKFKDWTYVQKVVGKDLVIAGSDQADRFKSERYGRLCLLGTVKGTVDFLRQYVGTRFLWPGLARTKGVTSSTDGITASDPIGTEFLKTSTIAVPADLNLTKTPLLLSNADFPRQTFYDISLNEFALLGGPLDAHSYDAAIPAMKYRDTHPEYFALINGKRCCLIPSGNPEWTKRPWVEQYCISNPEVQDLIYKRALERLDRGNELTGVGQPDGFQPCQCENCEKLYDTGKDWDEKLWVFHRALAERLLQERPEAKLNLMVYGNTGKPPKTFKRFPKNVILTSLGDSTEQERAIWNDVEVPGGYLSYLHTWGGYHVAGPYTPVRTPSYVEKMVKRLVKQNVRIIVRDGAIGYCWGLEAPVYYAYGRMFDDPATNNAKALLDEFCVAAFGKSAGSMKQFYDRLYKQIAVYSDAIGTHCPGWGLTRQHDNYNFSLVGYLYSPEFLAAAENDLKQAEKLADSDRVKARLSLIRLEFDYIKGLATIVHLYQAYQLRPDQASRDKLLDAIDQWHAGIYPLYNEKGFMKPLPGWPEMFPFSGHPRVNVAMEVNGYQNLWKDTCINWDTAAMRKASLAGETLKLAVKRAATPPTVNAAGWDAAVSGTLVDMKGGVARVAARTTVKALYDKDNLYVRLEAADVVEPPSTFTPFGRDGAVDKQESLDISLAPLGDRNKSYHFIVGPLSDSVYDAAHGFITDGIDPRAGKDDTTWNGDWRYVSEFDPAKKRWTAMLTIPFKTLGVAAPANGTVWQGNVGRKNVAGQAVKEFIWAFNPECKTFSDPRAFGDLVFGE
jgi:hypothetical protein